MDSNNIALCLKNISKSFPGVKALNDINLDFYPGRVHTLVGENGAGKSTLIKIITGAIKADSGEIFVEGKKYRSYSPHDALFDLGIAAIYQEFNLISSLSVAENIFLGKEKSSFCSLQRKQMHAEAESLLSELGFEIEPAQLIKALSVAEKQMVEIAKALIHNVKILIMDEPTAPLTSKEVQKLFDFIEVLKERGVSIIFISHRLEEALSISDRITVLRDGEQITTVNAKDTDRKALIQFMVGRPLGKEYPKHDINRGEKILSIKNLSTSKVSDINFDLYENEILGIGGLVGSGRTELVRAVYGIDRILQGSVSIYGDETKIKNPNDAMSKGFGLVPEDRKKSGIFGKLSIKQNISFSIVDKLTRLLFINKISENEIVRDYINSMSIKPSNEDQLVQYLSGGNQQKVILSKILATNCKILLLDEPTRGVDIGAKQEIYAIIEEIARSGRGIIMVSSDLPELINICDRIIVMKSGRIGGLLDKSVATQDKIMEIAAL
jgi:ribose transport system ATP-binding protein